MPRATAGWLGCFLPPFLAGFSHSVLLAAACPRRGVVRLSVAPPEPNEMIM
ncbi:MAG: hypothetical protein LC729_04910 [Acidobacteria bacterium]|nr:hypothetical protein [Acidobacteriota bacterium]